MQHYPNIVIGFGKAGKTLAKFLATQGQEVLVIEQSNQMYGGTCINIACLPSKRLVIAAHNGVPFPDAIAGKTEMTSQLRNKNYHMLADEPTITILDGHAEFIADHELAVTTTSGEVINVAGERIFINTGAITRIPAEIPGIADSPFLLTSTTLMEQTELPQELVILGGGYIGLEFASMMNQFGAHVTILDHNDQFLRREDDDVAQALYDDLVADGIDFKLGVTINQVINHTDQAEIEYTDHGTTTSITADKFVVAMGRTPNTMELGLANTNIQVNDRQAIVVNEHLQTSVDNVWAMGDVTGGLQFTYISLDDFRIVKDQLFGAGARTTNNRPAVPTSVFTQTPLANVGLTEKEAHAQGIDYLLFKLPVMAIPKAKVIGNQRGLYKALVNPTDHTLLGATLYGEESFEMINLLTTAINNHLPYETLRDQIYTHPTMTEALNDLFKAPLH